MVGVLSWINRDYDQFNNAATLSQSVVFAVVAVFLDMLGPSYFVHDPPRNKYHQGERSFPQGFGKFSKPRDGSSCIMPLLNSFCYRRPLPKRRPLPFQRLPLRTGT
jgi:hypothetical protein